MGKKVSGAQKRKKEEEEEEPMEACRGNGAVEARTDTSCHSHSPGLGRRITSRAARWSASSAQRARGRE